MTGDDPLHLQNAALARLSREAAAARADLDACFRSFTEVAADTLQAGRVGIWLYNADRTALVSACLYSRGTRAHTQGDVVLRADAPRYFATLDEIRTFVVEDATTDPRAAELTRGYHEPHGIGAAIDAPILVEGRAVGVVCHEHLGGPRAWSPSEASFAASIADFTALALERRRRRDAEAALREREELLRLALEAARMGTWAWEVASQRLSWSPHVGPLFGRPEGWQPADYAAYLALIAQEDRDAVNTQIAASLADPERPYVIEHRVIYPDGTQRWVECRGRLVTDAGGEPVAMRGTIADIDGRKTLEAQLLQAQKMEGIGRLAGGVAHDFNNLLTAIAGCSEVLRTEVPDRDQRYLDVIDRSVDRAAALTAQLLAFARKRSARPRVLDVAVVVRGLLDLLARLLGEDVQVSTAIDAGPAATRIDASQLEQVLVNLAINARDAMPSGGRLTLRVDCPHDGPEPRPEGWVRLRVSDTGAGMDAHVRARIFEPFFTTKPHGKGSGLGLATCYGIVTQAGGRIDVESAPGQGTTFALWLPRHPGPVDRDAGEPTTSLPPVSAGTLLLVEDDALVRELAVEVLRQAGFTVHVAASVAEARALAHRAPELDALVTDVVLPDGSGSDVAAALRELEAELKVLYVTGYAEDAVLGRGMAERGATLLTKPFRPSDLLGRVRALLAP